MKRSMFESQEPFSGIGNPVGQSVGSVADVSIPKDTILYIEKNWNGNYNVSGISKAGLGISQLWEVPYEDLPEKVKSELDMGKQFPGASFDLEKNEDVRKWAQNSFTQANNEGRLFPGRVDGAQEELLKQLRSDARSTLLLLDKPEKQETPKAAVGRSSLDKLNINRKVDGKYSMTAVFNGTAVTREASASEVMNLMAASPQEKVNTVAQIFNRPEIANPAMAEGTKEKITEAVAEFTQTATPESVSRPEIYASKTEHVSDVATNMQAAASASYNDIQQQQQSQEQSRTRSEGLGM